MEAPRAAIQRPKALWPLAAATRATGYCPRVEAEGLLVRALLLLVNVSVLIRQRSTETIQTVAAPDVFWQCGPAATSCRNVMRAAAVLAGRSLALRPGRAGCLNGPAVPAV